jgi:hypothetical protein
MLAGTSINRLSDFFKQSGIVTLSTRSTTNSKKLTGYLFDPKLFTVPDYLL